MSSSLARRLFLVFFHGFAQTQRPHVGPYFLDIIQAFLLGSGFSHIVPTQGIFPILWPNGILFFVVDHDFINGFIVLLVPTHGFWGRPCGLFSFGAPVCDGRFRFVYTFFILEETGLDIKTPSVFIRWQFMILMNQNR